ncbi:MAG: hypothetical protein KGL39_21990, partial [Patescibacteria group bacterium]|nr:hypothetical protein [Patescibacteria group bacterium]
MIGAWVVESKILFGSWVAFTAQMGRASAATQLLAIREAELMGRLDPVEAKMLRQGVAAETLAGKYEKLRLAIYGATALVGAAAIGYGVDQAGKFHLAMTDVALTLSATAQQRSVLENLAFQQAQITHISPAEAAQEEAMVARAGAGNFQRMQSMFPALSQFAAVQTYLSQARGQELNVRDAIEYGMQFAHLFQAYTPDAMHHMVEGMTKVMMNQPEALSRLVSQGKYFIPLGTALGMDQEQIMQILVMMGQTGFLKGRGGTAIQNAILGSVKAAAGDTTKKEYAGLTKLGILKDGALTIEAPGGKLDWDKFTKVLQHAADTMDPDTYVGTMEKAFGKQASQYLSVVFEKDPRIREQMKINRKQWEDQGQDPIEKFIGILNKELGPAWAGFVGGFNALATSVFLPVLPAVAIALNGVGQAFYDLANFFQAHPWLAGSIAILFGTITSAASLVTIRALTLSWLKLIGVMGAEGEAGTVAGAAGIVTKSFVGLASEMLAFNVVLAAIASTLGIFAGIAKDISDAAHNPIFAKVLGWAMSG